MSGVRVRFAPSPTGYLHIGGARTALFNWLFARRTGGTFVLRVEDTDADRTITDSAEKMMESFRWLGLMWDEGPVAGGEFGPYFQSQRRDIYTKYADILLEKGEAYPCYCTPEELKARRDEARSSGRFAGYDGRCRRLSEEEIRAFEAEGRKPALRLKTPSSGTTVVKDIIHGDVSFNNEEISDFVIMKSDGFPTYNFACVVDDHLMGITHVIRADEHLSNTPKQLMIYRAFGWTPPEFAHVPMILAPDRSKLSKRHGAQSVEEFRDGGYLPEAIVNYIALLGWTPPDPSREILSLEEMVHDFDLSKVSATPAIYDVTKLTWMNGYYMRTIDLDRLTGLYADFAVRSSLLQRNEVHLRWEWLKKVVSALRERARTLVEMVEASVYFFRDPQEFDPAGVKKYFHDRNVANTLRKCVGTLKVVDNFDAATLEVRYREMAEREGVKASALIHPTRLAITGRTAGPGLFEIMEILGKDAVVRRMARAAELIEAGAIPLSPPAP
ncbi:MAG TPA: glutamate--tRNA ligase [Firmicutes bacterium]|nr:glutamate--tRNA ligase [Candidatus Fermentithermobacillaceae bacterium]